MNVRGVVTRRQTLLAEFLRDVWSNGDVMRSSTYLASAYTIHHDPGDPWEKQTLDIAGFMDRVRLSRAPFPDQQFDPCEMIEGEAGVVVTWLWQATHSGDCLGFPATGKRVTASGVTVYYFDSDDRITGHWQIADRLGVFQQLQRARVV
jgi:steroid delta-isomerase-like uncharacterized protein